MNLASGRHVASERHAFSCVRVPRKRLILRQHAMVRYTKSCWLGFCRWSGCPAICQPICADVSICCRLGQNGLVFASERQSPRGTCLPVSGAIALNVRQLWDVGCRHAGTSCPAVLVVSPPCAVAVLSPFAILPSAATAVVPLVRLDRGCFRWRRLWK